MLFMVVARHSVEMCPGGSIRPDKEFIRNVGESMEKSGANLIDGYMDAPRHVFYFIIEASDNAALNNAVEPFRLVGKVTIIPIMKFFKEGSEWAKKLGIQH